MHMVCFSFQKQFYTIY
ncbi:hypothetical protein CIB84_002464 [Bambusicola thoracicus]|uniref:Uncharacterized protein n=1 Tax=Bambusicola thoracicus TaxID=9083 RepID=A0A2P4TBS9_BAMTH|nr:hypothetical protein CIB84_002464 [Bambusicola thoracicus]